MNLLLMVADSHKRQIEKSNKIEMDKYLEPDLKLIINKVKKIKTKIR